jgi:GTPase SAR1 family protein
MNAFAWFFLFSSVVLLVTSIVLIRRVVIGKKREHELEKESRVKSDRLEDLDQEMKERPKIEKEVYKIVTVGVPKSGKTSLTLKWANPIFDLGTVEGTEFEQYSRTISKIVTGDKVVFYDFELLDFGGEQIVDAHDYLVTQDIHGMLFVVDLGKMDNNQNVEEQKVDEDRIAFQLQEFNPAVLKFFFSSPRITQTCQSVVLFINKSDLLPGRPREVEEEAKKKYQDLLAELYKYQNDINITVIVGSAISGHNTHELFSHFVEQILPTDAYDERLFKKVER